MEKVVRDSARCLVIPLSREVEGEEEMQSYRFILPIYMLVLHFLHARLLKILITRRLVRQWPDMSLIFSWLPLMIIIPEIGETKAFQLMNVTFSFFPFNRPLPQLPPGALCDKMTMLTGSTTKAQVQCRQGPRLRIVFLILPSIWWWLVVFLFWPDPNRDTAMLSCVVHCTIVSLFLKFSSSAVLAAACSGAQMGEAVEVKT